MRNILFLLFVLNFAIGFTKPVLAQHKENPSNLVIFVMDGYRWKELFEGADSSLLFNKQFNQTDQEWVISKYWDADPLVRRHKLMPFVWDSIASKGQLYGNRNYGNQVDMMNSYWFSYPGRSEIFTGYFDTAVNSNQYPNNPNTNVLEFINQQPSYRDQIAVFSWWDAVARILNRERNGLLVNVFGEDVKGDNLTPLQKEANLWQHLQPCIFGKGERLAVGTYLLAKSYLLAKHPRILYIDIGDTDNFGHAGEYGNYLDAAHAADAMFRDIWEIIQKDPFYKNKTAMLIFPDHGRGLGTDWTKHGAKIAHSGETYLMAMGKGIKNKGEIKEKGQLYEAQIAQTIAKMLGFHFTATHPIADPIKGMNGK